MSHRTGTQRRTWKERALSLLLAAALVAGLVPGLTLSASAEHWADAYLDQLVDWGVMRADQTADPDADLSRAEFMAIVNRAYGYTDMGPIPFEDVAETDWFYDDISIAYTAGYMAGTSDTTASPNDTLTREQAICILGRNMMMKDAPGESLAFADSRDVSDWARGTLKAAADSYIISGYPDNTIHPKDNISKGQMAALIAQCIGTPIQQSGEYDLGGVFGNVTITAPNVTLRNAVISGDLYISGGVGLGGIKLENVDVLGRIIVSSTGESEGGEASVIMRNVTAEEMLVDNMQGKTVTIRADGITDIANTVVRTDAYLEDNNTDDKGLMRIELNGDPGTRLTLAGRIKQVVDKTPSSYIQVAQGTVAKLTMDEAATNSTVQLDRNTKVAEMNLDVATSVLGEGDIGQLNINAPGSIVTMLPDKIYIRPGLTASIAGVIMDHQAAEEGSLDPRLLSGYPAANDIAPTGFRADFAANKKGTIYWAVSYVSDGSIGENDLISPPSYGSKAITNGSLAAPTGGDEVSAQVGNLVVGGSYYLSAVVVDEQNNRSPVKVISFSTPDNTVPAFADGYPYMSRTTSSVAQVTVMPTKSCKLYYALLPKGAKAPTTNELKAAAVTGNLGYGMRDVTKNTEAVFTVNSQRLEELKDYVLYLWLTDVDGINSSAVTSLTFTIPDETPPEFVVHPYVNGNPAATSIPMAATVNENATIFWAVVEEGTNYPLPNNNSEPLSKDNEIVDGQVAYSKLTSDYAKLCVVSGMGALQKGQVTAQANTEVTFNLTGLLAEKAYDFYYLARDAAGNYTVQVYRILGLHTQDTTGPAVSQSFNAIPSAEAPNNPMSSTDIYLEFTENIRSTNSAVSNKDFLTLYNAKSKTEEDRDMFIRTLQASIVLYHIDPNSQSPEVVPYWNGRGDEPDKHWINYDNVIIRVVEDGYLRLTLPGTANRTEPAAVKLANGEQYFFQFQDLTDNATPPNPLNRYFNDQMNYTNADAKHNVPVFTTVFSQVLMRNIGPKDLPVWQPNSATNPTNESGKLAGDEDNEDSEIRARSDVNFRLTPQSTKNTDEINKFDVLIYNASDIDSDISFDLYYRITDANGDAIEGKNADPEVVAKYNPDYLLKDYTSPTGPDDYGWYFLGSFDDLFKNDAASVSADFNGCINNTSRSFPTLKYFSEDVYYEFVISVTKDNEQTEYEKFTDPVTLDIYIEAGQLSSIYNLSQQPGMREQFEANGLGQDDGVVNIGLNSNTGEKHLKITKSFPNTQAPSFFGGRAPWFSSNATGSIQYMETAPTGYDDTISQTALVGDTYAYVFVNMDIKGTVYYAVSAVASGMPPTLVGNFADGDSSKAGAMAWNYIPTDGTDDTIGNENAGELTEGVALERPVLSQIARDPLPTSVSPVMGSEAYVNAWSDQRIRLDGLTADTEYYIYFVLESEKEGTAPGNRSPVYVYKFKTAKTTAPRIQVTDPGTGTVSVDTSWGNDGMYSVESELKWRIIQSAQADQFQKAGVFTFNITYEESADDLNYKIIQYYKDKGLKDSNDDDIGGSGVDTLYEALSIRYYPKEIYTSSADLKKAEFGEAYEGYTLFDLFASSTNRSVVQSVIESGGSNDIRGLISVNFDDASTTSGGNYTTPVNWTTGPNVNLDTGEGGTYLFLISGHNVNSKTSGNVASINSFYLLDNVEFNNTNAPKITDPQNLPIGSVFVVGTGDDATITADFTVHFDKMVYWKENNKYYKVEGNGNSLTTNASGDDIVGVEYELSKGTDSAVDFSADVKNPTFSFTFSNITRSVSTFTILGGNEGKIAANKGSTSGPIIVNVTYKEDPVTNATSGVTDIYWVTSGTVTYNGTEFQLSGDRKKVRSEGGGAAGASLTTASAPALTGVTASNVTGTSTGSYSMTLGLTFDQALYTKTGNSVTAVSGSKLATTSTVDYDPVKAGASMGSISSSGSGKTYTLRLTNVKPGTITLPSQTFYDKTGKASTTGEITIEISEVKGGSNASKLAITTPQVTVSFGDFEQTKILK